MSRTSDASFFLAILSDSGMAVIILSNLEFNSSIFSINLSFVNIPKITLWIVFLLSVNGKTIITADPIVPHAIAIIAQNVKYPSLNSPEIMKKVCN